VVNSVSWNKSTLAKTPSGRFSGLFPASFTRLITGQKKKNQIGCQEELRFWHSVQGAVIPTPSQWWICSKTSLTGDPGSVVSVGASPERELLPPLGGKQIDDPLEQ
jgi:hypothetical protein